MVQPDHPAQFPGSNRHPEPAHGECHFAPGGIAEGVLIQATDDLVQRGIRRPQGLFEMDHREGEPSGYDEESMLFLSSKSAPRIQ